MLVFYHDESSFAVTQNNVQVPKSVLIKDGLEFFLVFVSSMSPSDQRCNVQR